MPLPELKSKYRKVPSLEKARNGWQEEYEVSSRQVVTFLQSQSIELVIISHESLTYSIQDQ